MYRDFNELSYGDVIILDNTIYATHVDAKGSILWLGQHGNLDEGQDIWEEEIQGNEPTIIKDIFASSYELPYDKIGNKGELLAGKPFVVTQTQMDGMSEEQASSSDDPNVECGKLVTARELESFESGYLLKDSGLIVRFNQGIGFEHRIHFPEKIGTMTVERIYLVSGFTPVT